MLVSIADLPPVLQAIVALDAWNELAVMQHALWRERLPAAQSRARPVSPPVPIWLRSISASKPFPSIGVGIVIVKPGCSPLHPRPPRLG